MKGDASFAVVAWAAVGAAFITAAVGLARRLEIEVVAEGIETEEEAGLMHEFGCRRGQGYLWAPALPADAATRLLETGSFPS